MTGLTEQAQKVSFTDHAAQGAIVVAQRNSTHIVVSQESGHFRHRVVRLRADNTP
jgi:hypothetical protein